ncbi:hypothetical protein CK203_090453 [Vitis vinifera]|uniref:Uncharacterized protein n=1 Tax=Vitis vinifera TaxID=29760 RepID=A0A438BVR2_VITVI|nr:hypothetical protein CK203_090453 [Vitis vinifera]
MKFLNSCSFESPHSWEAWKGNKCAIGIQWKTRTSRRQITSLQTTFKGLEKESIHQVHREILIDDLCLSDEMKTDASFPLLNPFVLWKNPSGDSLERTLNHAEELQLSIFSFLIYYQIHPEENIVQKYNEFDHMFFHLNLAKHLLHTLSNLGLQGLFAVSTLSKNFQIDIHLLSSTVGDLFGHVRKRQPWADPKIVKDKTVALETSPAQPAEEELNPFLIFPQPEENFKLNYWLAIPDKIPKCPLTRLSYSYSDYLTLKTKTLLRGQEEAEIELGADSKCAPKGEAENEVEFGWSPPKVLDREGRPTNVIKPKLEWDRGDNEASENNARAMYSIFNAISTDEFRRIATCTSAKEAWDILQVTHEGTNAVKVSKLQMLTSRFETIRMEDHENFGEFYAKLMDIVNSSFNLGEPIPNSKVVRKILRSLPERFRAKVTAIEESKDVDS